MRLRRKKTKVSSAINPDVVSVWKPRIELGKLVKEGKITALIDIMAMGKPILESEIVDVLVPGLMQDTLDLSTTQRMTDSGRKAKYRAIVIIGDGKEYVGIGQGKADEAKPAAELAVKNAKLNIIHTILGCGSAECGCGTKHSLPIKITGKHGGVSVTLKPAPRGTGVVANPIIRKVLQMAGLKDIWTRAEGRTRNRYNTAAAAIAAIDMLNQIRLKKEWN